MLTIYYAVAANLNPGVVTVIWNMCPFMVAFADYLMFGVVLHWHHLAGMICMAIGTILLSLIKLLDKNFAESVTQVGTELVPTYVPVLFGVITPIFFTISGMLTKKLVTGRMQFNPGVLSMMSICFVDIIILVGAAIYWAQTGTFSHRLFLLGLFGSIFDTIGKVCSYQAMCYGRAGTTTALGGLAGVYLVIVEAIKTSKSPTAIEFVALFVCLLGSLVLVIPDVIMRVFCCRKPQQEKVEEKEEMLGHED